LQQVKSEKGDPTYYACRRPMGSALDLERPLMTQFDLLGVTDNVRYPAFVYMSGGGYTLASTRAAETV